MHVQSRTDGAGAHGGFEAWALPLLTLLLNVLFIRGYGYFRDELYYLANGEHLGLGYVEHPPLIGFIAAFVRLTLGESRFAIRLLPALAAAATVWLAARMAAEMGGGRFARLLAGVSVMLLPAFVGLFSVFTVNAFDVLFWAACTLVVLRILGTGNDRLWLVFGLLAGIGLENKISVLFLGFGVAAGLLLAREWKALASRRLWIGGAVAAAIFLPYVLWQAANGWPLVEFMENARRLKNVDLGFGEFMWQQALQANLLALPVWLAGLAFLLSAPSARAFRAAGWIYPAVLAAMLAAGDAKPYYLAPAYTLLFAAGGVAIERWTRTRARAVRPAALVAVVAGGLVSAPIARPILPVDTYVRYAAFLGVQPSSGERHETGRLPQMFADEFGWHELAETVARVYRSLPPADQARACILAQNYGEAGAIDLFGPALGLPKAISGHNSYFLWGPHGCTGEVVIDIGASAQDVEPLFASVERATLFTCTDCMPYEDNKPIWILREPRQPLSVMWPRFKGYI
jgi:hypothetical protein